MKPLIANVLLAATLPIGAAPAFLDDQFELPPGFHIYKVASADLAGGSYDLAFDGDGRLLVGDGKAVRRLYDDDGDSVLDRHDVIAEGLGPRGPQGLLVVGDRLYAVGGDGLQLFEGYQGGGTLIHRGRLGEPFHTGGDHAAHTILRGHDGHLYFVTGDGGGTEGRRHITEPTSPALRERAASVFRISPDGARWECLATGGRNPPSLGMNFLGELFSWDSDMEWHVDLPFYRPLRLNHWVQGGDQGWQGVGAYPPYYVDALPPVLATGRGSPDWGVFYEHHQFPAEYQDDFFVCDYLWKSATSGQYDTSGRLMVFSLSLDGAGWAATMDTFARPKPGARDAQGRPINFALVDVEVAPDGSLLLSDHNQGVWRIVHAPDLRQGQPPPPILPPPAPLPASRDALLQTALDLPQPGAEWSRLKWVALQEALGDSWRSLLQAAALDGRRPARERLKALRLLAPEYAALSAAFLESLAHADAPELRGQVAWLLGLQSNGRGHPLALRLLTDPHPFVRRRAAEAFTRGSDRDACPPLVSALSDADRLVRYVAMNALAHRPADAWLDQALQSDPPQTRVRALVALHLQGQRELPNTRRDVLLGLLRDDRLSPEDQLDLLRVLGLYREALSQHNAAQEQVAAFLLDALNHADASLRWEAARLLGEYNVPGGFTPLLVLLEQESDPVTQFHLAQAVARLDGGWDEEGARRLRAWFVAQQEGWFAQLEGKGRQFSDFWGTVLAQYAGRHRTLLAEEGAGVQRDSQLGHALLEMDIENQADPEKLFALYRSSDRERVRRLVLRRLADIPQPAVASFLVSEFAATSSGPIRTGILQALVRVPRSPASLDLLKTGLSHDDLDLAMACARALSEASVTLDQAAASALLTQVARHPEAIGWISPLLVRWAGQDVPGWMARSGRDEGDAQRLRSHWHAWFEAQFGAPFQPGRGVRGDLRTNEAVLDFLNSDRLPGGDARRGRDVFARAQCLQCHGGPNMGGRLFGPDLIGVTRRLQRAELAEALVLPSRNVVDRFQATEVELKDGRALTGFVTERDDRTLTLSVQDSIQRIPVANIEAVQPQTQSLMPEGLLNGLSWEEIRDLYAYLDALGVAE